MKSVTIIQGDSPIVLGQPHSGTWLPDAVRVCLNPLGKKLLDTDWHVDRLYDGLLEGASVVRANFHRYVIDANRDPSGDSLYPGQNTTGLVPLISFDGEDIWEARPTADEQGAYLEQCHRLYHEALSAEIERVRARHGVAILYDCHSIRSQIPFLFEGKLPDFNIGDFNGQSCALTVTEALSEVCGATNEYSSVVNGRFKGGWTTRHYGDPANGVHAIQMEISQSTYLDYEIPPFNYSEEKASKVRQLLADILGRLDTLARTAEFKGRR